MRLTLYTDYAYRLLIYLGSFPDEVVSARDVAAVYDIPLNHLTKITQSLSKAGYIHSKRGRAGGMHLARKPEDIALSDVYKAMTKQPSLLLCTDKTVSDEEKRKYCLINDSCALKGILRQSLTAFINVLDQYKLSDILNAKEKNALLLKRKLLEKEKA